MFGTEKPLDNPLNWSFRVGRLFGIDIRVHIAFVICAIVLVWMERPDADAIWKPSLGSILIHALGTYALLFFIVLLHEFGHCFGARYMGGEADEILLWPLGGLAYTNPPHNPAAHMVTTIAGPSVNLILCMICTVVLVLWTGSLGAVPWNPLHPMRPVDPFMAPTTAQFWVLRFFGISYFLLLINLLPIFPFDGGRIVQAWLWPKKGYKASMMTATSTGMVGAILVGLFALFMEESWLLLMIAVFGYLTCYQTRRTLKFEDDFGSGEFGYNFSQGYTSLAGDEARKDRGPGFWAKRHARKVQNRTRRDHEKRAERTRAVERILQKISESGVQSLAPRERRILEQETERQREVSNRSGDDVHI